MLAGGSLIDWMSGCWWMKSLMIFVTSWNSISVNMSKFGRLCFKQKCRVWDTVTLHQPLPIRAPQKLSGGFRNTPGNAHIVGWRRCCWLSVIHQPTHWMKVKLSVLLFQTVSDMSVQQLLNLVIRLFTVSGISSALLSHKPTQCSFHFVVPVQWEDQMWPHLFAGWMIEAWALH